MPGSDLDLLLRAAERAGQIALPYWRNQPQNWEKDANAGPVSEADIAVNDMLSDMLMTARPDYGWLSEESDYDPARLDRENVFIIDPIDGTRAFIAGDDSWSVSLAIAQCGVVTAGVIFLPAKKLFFAAQKGCGATVNGTRIQASRRARLPGASTLATRMILDAKYWRGGAPELDIHFRPSLAYRMALVAQGKFDAMMTLRDTWEWDVAAGTLIATEAGAIVSDRNDKAPVFNNVSARLNGLVAAGPALHAALVERLRRADGPAS